MLAARVLADTFRQVTVLERDVYPHDRPDFRPGVPQSRQLHVLLLRGQHVLEQLFPQLRSHLLELGALPHDYGTQSLYYYRARCHVSHRLDGWLCSRSLLEWQIRRELLASYPHIHFLEGNVVTHLLSEPHTPDVVTGVQFQTRNHKDDLSLQRLDADLVVDASGGSSRAPQWLQMLGNGYEAPQETVVDAQLGYATRFYASSTHAPYKFISIQSPGGRRSGSLLELEEGKLVVVLAGKHGDYPPQTNDGYLAFAKALPDQILYDRICELAPITPIYGYRRTANRWRHFEQLKTVPHNFLVMGDAFCMFNPVYGQGMTVAALEARALHACLKRRHGRSLSRRFHRINARIIRMPWLLATMVDQGMRSADASPIAHNHGSIMRRYMDRVTMCLSADAHVLLSFVKVVHMLQSPFALMSPSILFRVLFCHTAERRPSG
ncbi:hypothetical protein KDA_49550 [Dictyobacter alpinus]|uniref:FAD-binding domain-containing protein n=1 Tax=Dictyobacter alpinus TaxID=2014873 RepID=A0A402BDI4_9CHLR|nr:hypothetical protein KDA_49550 [Dictyobacter alpinus]